MNKAIFICLILFFTSSTSANNPALQYLFPLPGSEHHPPSTPIIIRFKEIRPQQITNRSTFISVVGSQSGSHRGKSKISTDQETIIFYTFSEFWPGETVSVTIQPLISGQLLATENISFDFKIAPDQANITLPVNEDQESVFDRGKNDQQSHKPAQGYPLVHNGVSIPDNFPWVNITVNDNPDSGYIFINNWGTPYYMMILDNSGFPIWYLRTFDRRRDFKVQKDGRLTMLVRGGYGGGSHIALDSTYAVVDTFFVPQGYGIDEHELQVLPNGHYFLIATDSRTFDLSDSVEGGSTNATVIGNHAVEMDADDNPVLIWRCWEYLDITDATHIRLKSSYIDYVHMNAIEVDHDGHLLISSRNLSEVTKVHRQNGNIIWRLGGENNQFTWIDYDSMSYQHDIRVLENGHYTVFDNGNYHTPKGTWSRALELELDTLAMTARNVWEYRETPDIYSRYLGNTQRLPNGNTLINWAVTGAPKLLEVRPDGTKAFELDFASSVDCYRTFRFPWRGKAAVPYLLAESWSDRITLLFNKFGDADVSEYRVYGGQDPDQLPFIASTADPFLHFFSLESGKTYYFRVTAVSSTGQESDFSDMIDIVPQIADAGQNVVLNGDFSTGLDYWEFEVDTSQARADWQITPQGRCQVLITDQGTSYNDINLYYPNVQLLKDKTYVFEFDAWAAEERVISVDLKQISSPFQNYSQKGFIWLTSDSQHVRHQFTMNAENDYSAAFSFDLGGYLGDVSIDNVSLRKIEINDLQHNSPLPLTFRLEQNHPNPFNPSTTIKFQLPEPSQVTIEVFSLLGEKISTLIDARLPAGVHHKTFRADGISSGIYFYKLSARAMPSSMHYSEVRKMVLLR